MNSLDTTSSLHSLLLFQSLASFGTHLESFEAISKALRQCSLLKNHNQNPLQDPNLSPESLRDSYITLLKEKAKQEFHASIGNDEVGSTKAVTNGTRASKSPSPTFDRPEEITQHDRLIPKIIPALYARYRDRVIEDVKAHERQYDALVQDLRQLQVPQEDGKIDSRSEKSQVSTSSKRQDEASASKDAGAFSSTHRTSPSKESEKRSPQKGSDLVEETSSETSRDALRTQERSSEVVQLSSRPRADVDSGMERENLLLEGIKAAPSEHLMSPRSQGKDSSDENSRPSSQQNAKQSSTSIDSIINHDPTEKDDQKSIVHSTEEAISHSSAIDHTKRPDQPPISNHASKTQSAQPDQKVAPNIRSQSHPSPIRQTPPAAPVAYLAKTGQHASQQRSFPPAANMQPPSYPPNAPWIPSQDAALANQHPPPYQDPHRILQSQDRPYGAPPGPQYEQGRSPHGHYPSSQHVPPELWRYQQHPQYSTPPNRSSVQYPPYQGHASVPPHRGGIMLPPFQVAMPNSSNQAKTVPAAPAQRQPPPKNLPPPLNIQDLPKALDDSAKRTPTSSVNTPKTTSWAKQFHGQNITVTPGSSTAWKTPSDVKSQSYFDKELPAPPMSPTFGRPVSPEKSKARLESGTLNKPPMRKGKQQQQQQRKVESRTNSTDDDRTRSQSLDSQHEQMSQLTRKGRLKHEPSTSEDIKPSISIKRKRPAFAVSEDREPETPPAATSPVPMFASQPPESIIGFRNFNKIAAPIMSTISSHKHASLFENRVTDRQAEGYSSFIKRPQDLKSIRSALAAGSRAVAAALAAAQNTDSPGGSRDSSTIVLPVSKDVIPPKAIVNAAQLEQELMRIFANAVMFAPGFDDEMVIDTQDMLESVEQELRAWKAADPRLSTDFTAQGSVAGEDAEGEVGDGEGSVESAGGRASKRRRL